MHYSYGHPSSRTAQEHEDDFREGQENEEDSSGYDNNLNTLINEPGENEDQTDFRVLRNSGNFDEDTYSEIDIDEHDEDRLAMKFEIRPSEKGLDKDYMKRSILSHKKVRQFLMNEGNDFDVTLDVWEYQKDSAYSYIPTVGKFC